MSNHPRHLKTKTTYIILIMTQETQRLIVTHVSDETSQTPLPKGMEPQYQVIVTMQSPGNRTGNKPVPVLSCSERCPSDFKESENHKLTTLYGDTTIPPVTITNLITGGMVAERWTDQWIVSSANLYGGPKMNARNALRASAFSEEFSSSWSGRLRSLCQCNCPEWLGLNKTESPG